MDSESATAEVDGLGSYGSVRDVVERSIVPSKNSHTT